MPSSSASQQALKPSSPYNEAINALRPPCSDLGSTFAGELVFPDSLEYTNAIARYFASSVLPAGAVAYPRSDQDVSALIKWAAKSKVDVAVCGGGHAAGTDSSSNGGLVIDLGKYINSVVVHSSNKTAVVGGGARFVDVEKAVAPFSLSIAGPVVNDTGVGGLSLGGGVGFLTGTSSLTIDNVLAATVVLASGEIVQVNADSHPDLYWAIRGGGGAFGVVTSFTFRLHDQRPTVGFMTAIFTPDQLPTLLPKIRNWLDIRTPEEMAGLVFVTKEGKPLLLFLGFYNGAVHVGQQKFSEIVETAISGKDMKEIHASEMNTQLSAFGVRGETRYQTSSFLGTLNDETVTMIYEKFDAARAGSHPRVTDLKVTFFFHNWDAASKVDPHATPFFNRAKNQTFLGIEIEYIPGEISVARDLGAAFRRLGGSQSAYINYETERADASEDERDVRARATFGDENLARLRNIKAKYDPERIFRSWFA